MECWYPVETLVVIKGSVLCCSIWRPEAATEYLKFGNGD